MSDEAEPRRILVSRNGPYIVTGSIPLVQRYPAMSVHGEPLAWDPVGAVEPVIEVEEEMYLCRCGQSRNKPFCDSSHKRVGFDGTLATLPADPEHRQIFQGEGVVMTDEVPLCSETGFCGTRFTRVWEMIARTGDPEVRARLLEMVKNCPSGRLVAYLNGSSTPDEPAFEPSIALVTDGPLWVRGGIEIQTPDGAIYSVRNRVTLCRCGQSKNKPFCDGAHERAGFKAPLLQPGA